VTALVSIFFCVREQLLASIRLRISSRDLHSHRDQRQEEDTPKRQEYCRMSGETVFLSALLLRECSQGVVFLAGFLNNGAAVVDTSVLSAFAAFRRTVNVGCKFGPLLTVSVGTKASA
jgi:hypothetical protein